MMSGSTALMLRSGRPGQCHEMPRGMPGMSVEPQEGSKIVGLFTTCGLTPKKVKKSLLGHIRLVA